MLYEIFLTPFIILVFIVIVALVALCQYRALGTGRQDKTNSIFVFIFSVLSPVLLISVASIDTNSMPQDLDNVISHLEEMGFQVIENSDGEIKVLGVSVDTRKITERSLYGHWVNTVSANGNGYALQFVPSVTYGPYTFTRLGFEGNSVWVQSGFYEINFDGELLLHYRERRHVEDLIGENSEAFEFIQRWEIEFITQDILQAINGDSTLVMQRVAITQPSVEQLHH